MSKHTPKPGYAAGNILNLLVHLGADLTGYDFSGLSVWQAYVPGIELEKADFAYTDFRYSAFTRPFGTVLCVAFSPNSQFIAAGSNDGHIRIWNVSDLQQVVAYDAHNAWVTTIA